MHDSRQGRIHESGRFGQGPRGARDHQRRGRARRAFPRRRHRRGHGRQYRDRHRDGRERARLSERDRDSRHPGAGKKRRAAPRRRRIDRSARRSLFQPQQLRALLRTARGDAGENRTQRRRVGEPVRQCRQPPRPLRDDRPGDFRRSRRQRSRFRQRGRLRRHARRRRHGAEGTRPEHQNRARRSAGSGALFLLHDRRTEEFGLVDHRGHRPGARHRQPRGRARRRRLSDSRRGGAADRL